MWEYSSSRLADDAAGMDSRAWLDAVLIMAFGFDWVGTPVSKTTQWPPSRRTPACWRAAAASLLVLGLAGFGFTAPATAAPAPLEFIYSSTIDTTDVGGAPGTPVHVIYKFDPSLAPGSGSSGANSPTDTDYGPLQMATIQIGDQCVAVSGTGTSIEIFNDAGTTTLNDAYAVRAERPATSGILLFGREFVLMFVQFVDDNLDMFTDASLPSNTNFMAKADSQQTTFRLRNFDRRFVSLFTADPYSVKPFDHVAHAQE